MKDEEKLQDDSIVSEKIVNTNKWPKKWLIMVVVLTLALAGAAALYLNSRSSVSDKDNQISLLQSQIDVLSIGNNVDKGVSAVEPVELDDPVPAPLPVTDCTGGSDYSADIGNFSIDLDSPRVIIRNLDAGFEGGPITSLETGTCIEGEDNVVDTPPTAEVKILAHPSSSSADLRASYEAGSGALTASGNVTIDGVAAQKYTLDGLFVSTAIYFDNAGIGYEITLSDTNTVTQATLTDVISDWNFIP